jgi:hypothetical protein
MDIRGKSRRGVPSAFPMCRDRGSRSSRPRRPAPTRRPPGRATPRRTPFTGSSPSSASRSMHCSIASGSSRWNSKCERAERVVEPARGRLEALDVHLAERGHTVLLDQRIQGDDGHFDRVEPRVGRHVAPSDRSLPPVARHRGVLAACRRRPQRADPTQSPTALSTITIPGSPAKCSRIARAQSACGSTATTRAPARRITADHSPTLAPTSKASSPAWTSGGRKRLIRRAR